MRILLVTGLSGAGKSVALKTLEDIGCEAVDNGEQAHSLAIGTDARNRDFSIEHFQELLKVLRTQQGHEVIVIFFDCDNEVLQRRFTETRRKHPLALDRPVMDGILHERALLAPLRDIADITFNTSEWTSGDLRHALREHFTDDNRALSVFVTSFSFKRGLPRDADMVFDARFLHNPFYEDQLRALTGLDAPVAQFIGKLNLHEFAIGCTGGRHRSVFISEKLAGFLKQKEYKVGIRHRDLSAEYKEKLG